jgi:poly-gamma-glutamate synthesis protein (capsule biosynthesis protein)
MKAAYLWIGIAVLLTWAILRIQGTETFRREVAFAPSEASTTIVFAGDIMLGRYVETLSENDHSYPFKDMSPFLKRSIVIANLEGPVPEKHKQTPISGFTFSFPPYVPRILKEQGVTAVSLANNHMFDSGISGYEDTKQALDGAGVAHFGGYSPTSDDFFRVRLGDKEAVVYGITMIATGWDEDQALDITRKLRREHPYAYLIAFLHWGDEYQTQNVYQRDFAHKLIDSGVDAIIGSHPHVIQGIESYKGKPIVYSLGNFIFDQYFSKETQKGLMVEISSNWSAYDLSLIPILSQRSVPYLAQEEEKKDVLEMVAVQSDPALRVMIRAGKIRIQKTSH